MCSLTGHPSLPSHAGCVKEIADWLLLVQVFKLSPAIPSEIPGAVAESTGRMMAGSQGGGIPPAQCHLGAICRRHLAGKLQPKCDAEGHVCCRDPGRWLLA